MSTDSFRHCTNNDAAEFGNVAWPADTLSAPTSVRIGLRRDIQGPKRIPFDQEIFASRPTTDRAEQPQVQQRRRPVSPYVIDLLPGVRPHSRKFFNLKSGSSKRRCPSNPRAVIGLRVRRKIRLRIVKHGVAAKAGLRVRVAPPTDNMQRDNPCKCIKFNKIRKITCKYIKNNQL